MEILSKSNYNNNNNNRVYTVNTALQGWTTVFTGYILRLMVPEYKKKLDSSTRGVVSSIRFSLYI